MAHSSDVPAFGLLQGVRVVFAAQVYAAPHAAEMWAENGADVIWLENPGNPDPMRAPIGYAGPRERQNMRTISLNTKAPAGQEALLAILRDTDIFLEASRGGQYAGWGLTDERLWEANPRLVIIHVSGFGQTGEPDYVKRAAWDTIGQAYSGWMALNGTPEEPIAAKPYLCDYITALNACWAGLAALHRAEQTGHGESIDVAMYEALLRASGDNPAAWATDGAQTPRSVRNDPRAIGYQNYKCADGKFVAVVTAGVPSVKAMCSLLGITYGQDVPKGMPMVPAGTPGGEKFDQALAQWCLERTADQAQAEINAAGGTAQKVYEYVDLFNDPHVKARGDLFDFDDPQRGTVKGAVAPIPKLTRNPQKLWRRTPAPGADSRDILADAGYTDDQIEQLAEQGIVKAAQPEATDRTLLTTAG